MGQPLYQRSGTIRRTEKRTATDGDHLAYPRPQLVRPRWINLDGAWGFAYDDADRGLDECWQDQAEVFPRTIQVPFPPESPASGIGDPTYHPVVWYRRTFEVAPDEVTPRLVLHCGAIDYRATVWVNGRLVATHEGGQTPFSADITAALHPNGEQVIVIRAEDDPLDLAQPRGKQDWEVRPHKIWYERTTGIWQPVWLEPVNATRIEELRWTPHVDRTSLGLAVTLARTDDAPLHLRVHLSLHGQTIADDEYAVRGRELEREIALDVGAGTMTSEQLLWSPHHPNLIEARLTLRRGEQVLDEVESYAGLRSVVVDRGHVMLNGFPYYLTLALAQGYWPESHLAAPSGEALRREVALARELGFNGVRVHQKVEDPRFLSWCDRLGLLVWGEMANAYQFSPTAVERITREWLAVLNRDYSHPCIIAWVPINESWGVPALARDPAQQHVVQALYHLTRALDPTRPVMGNEGWEHVASDILGIHDYSQEGQTLLERYGGRAALERTIREVQPGKRAITLRPHPDETPAMLTEFGGMTLPPPRGEAWFGYAISPDRAAFLAAYRDLVLAARSSSVLAGFCYTQLTDTGQETNGLLTEQREPKIDPRLIRAINSEPLAAAAQGSPLLDLEGGEESGQRVLLQGSGKGQADDGSQSGHPGQG